MEREYSHPMTLHRYMLNRRLAAATPLTGRVLEVGNGRRRRGIETGAAVTLDLSAARAPHVQADALRLPFADGTFDGVVCCETLQYVETPEHVVREIRRVLTRDGRLVLSLPFQRAPHRLDTADRLYRWTEQCGRDLLACCRFAVTRFVPLWPPMHGYTSGWLIEARAA